MSDKFPALCHNCIHLVKFALVPNCDVPGVAAMPGSGRCDFYRPLGRKDELDRKFYRKLDPSYPYNDKG